MKLASKHDFMLKLIFNVLKVMRSLLTSFERQDYIKVNVYSSCYNTIESLSVNDPEGNIICQKIFQQISFFLHSSFFIFIKKTFII